jgi:hypothetical protein
MRDIPNYLDDPQTNSFLGIRRVHPDGYRFWCWHHGGLSGCTARFRLGRHQVIQKAQGQTGEWLFDTRPLLVCESGVL